MAACPGQQRIWKSMFILGCVTIASIVMQYVVVGNVATVFGSTRYDVVIRVSRSDPSSNEQLQSRQYTYDESVRMKDNNLSLTHQLKNISVQFRNRSIQLKDDVFLEWNQEEKMSLAVFIMSVISVNQTHPVYKHALKLNGWEAFKHRKYVYKCCIRWKHDKLSIYVAPNRTYWKRDVFPATQYTCPIRGPPRDILGVAIEFNRKKCPSVGTNRYIKPFLPVKRHPNSFAICAKIVYGNVDYKLLVDWIEYYRELKVDKIIMFVYKVEGMALQVLRHYSLGKFVEIRRFDFPWKTGRLSRDVGIKNSRAWQDEQVVVFDCYERLSGYAHIAIVDLDEFILPKRHANLKQMMLSLRQQYPRSAGFTFHAFLYLKDWGPVAPHSNGSDITRYYNRTGPVLTRKKNVLIRNRVVDGSVCTHEFTPRPGYNRTILPHTFAVIHHYRNCYSNYRKTCAQRPITDRSIARVVRKMKTRTDKVLATIEGFP